jgi:hypothetical protein
MVLQQLQQCASLLLLLLLLLLSVAASCVCSHVITVITKAA